MTPLELKNTRKSMGLTQAQLAELIGVTDSTVARWEMGVHPIAFPIEQILKAQAASAETTSEWTDLDLSQIAEQARLAFEQLRLKKCLVLTKILLQADPQHEEARALESSIVSALQRDIQNVRAQIEDAQLTPQAVRRRAEIILWRVLSIDPKNEEAKALLSTLKTQWPDVVAPQVSSLPTETELPPRDSFHELPAEVHDEPVSLPVFSNVAKRPQRRAFPLTAAVVLIIAGILIITMLPRAPKPQDIASASAASAMPPERNREANADGVQSSANDDAYSDKRLAAFSPLSSPLPDERGGLLAPAVVAAPFAPAAPSPARKDTELPPPAASDEMGTLAVNSLLPAEIYMGGKYMGTTPTTLELPAGTHTLEYRHQDLRKVVTHVVRANEVTAQRITFEVTVQINAKPWANVFLEGTERQALGQTPLSGVTVPAGSTLLFENPNFPRKAYRVAGSDTAIQVVFP